MTRRLIPVLAAALVLAPSTSAMGAEQAPAKQPAAAAAKNLLPDKADDAWAEVKKSMNPPAPPKEWNEKAPTDEQQAAFRKQMATLAGAAADKAREFYTRFPEDGRAAKAKDDERRMLTAAVGLGDASRADALKAAGGPPGPSGPDEADPLQKKLREAATKAQAKQSEGLPVVFAEFEKAVRVLQKEFPDRPEIHAALLEVAEGLGHEKAVAIAKEIAEAKTEPSLNEQASALLKKLERLGKPVSVAFTAVDGRKVDLLGLKGKVVLVDFWATWCGPCVAELPKVKAAYDKLHDKGFEIVGISFDEDKEALTKFVAKKQMAWPQYFDGEGWGNKFGREFGISAIPAMWLIDKKGNLVDQNAREDLEGKVEKLLAEK